MKTDSLEQLQKEVSEIFEQVFAPDSIPGKLLHADKPNNSEKWEEENDTKQCEENLDEFLDTYQGAIEILAKN